MGMLTTFIDKQSYMTVYGHMATEHLLKGLKIRPTNLLRRYLDHCIEKIGFRFINVEPKEYKDALSIYLMFSSDYEYASKVSIDAKDPKLILIDGHPAALCTNDELEIQKFLSDRFQVIFSVAGSRVLTEQ